MGAGTAFGIAVSTEWTTPSYKSVIYKQKATVAAGYNKTTKKGSAAANVMVKPHDNASEAGYIGTKPYLYKKNGSTYYKTYPWTYTQSKVKKGEWHYSPYAEATGLAVNTSWFSWGSSEHWNGNTYKKHDTYKSPLQTVIAS